MTMLLIDGFDAYSDINDVVRSWQSPVGSPVLSTSVFRTGRAAVRCAQSGQYLTHTTATASQHATFACGAGFYLPVTPGATDVAIIMAFKADDAATTHVLNGIKPDGNIVAYRGTTATVLGTSTNALYRFGAWNFIEAKVALHDSTGTVTVKVNGTQALGLTGQDTKNAGTDATFDTVAMGYISGTTVLDVYMDDAYILNGAGSSPVNDLLGECRVRTVSPNGNGNTSGFTGSDSNSTDNYALVDDTTKNTADYVTATADNTKDTYAFADIPDTTGTPIAIQISTYAAKTDTGAKSIAHVTRSAATEGDSSDIVLATSYSWQKSIRETLPSGSMTIANVNASEFGVKARP